MCPLLPPTQICCNFHILPRILVCCIMISSIATNNCLLHVASITTNTNSLQPTYITSKTSSLHYHIIYRNHIWYVAKALWCNGSHFAVIWPYGHVILEWQYFSIATLSFVAIMKYCSQVFRGYRTLGNQSNRCNICSCNQVLVAVGFFLHCNSKICCNTTSSVVAWGYCTVPTATIYRPPDLDAIDSSCNQNSHIATKYRRWPRPDS